MSFHFQMWYASCVSVSPSLGAWWQPLWGAGGDSRVGKGWDGADKGKLPSCERKSPVNKAKGWTPRQELKGNIPILWEGFGDDRDIAWIKRGPKKWQTVARTGFTELQRGEQRSLWQGRWREPLQTTGKQRWAKQVLALGNLLYEITEVLCMEHKV